MKVFVAWSCFPHHCSAAVAEICHAVTRGRRGPAKTGRSVRSMHLGGEHADSVALPMTVCDASGGAGDDGDEMTFSGLMVYRVTPQDGFSLTGQVTHPPDQGIGCDNWWTDARSQVERSVFMDDHVFSISHSRLKVNAMGALARDLVDISFD